MVERRGAFGSDVTTCPWCEKRLNTGGLIPPCTCRADRFPHEDDFDDELHPVRKPPLPVAPDEDLPDDS